MKMNYMYLVVLKKCKNDPFVQLGRRGVELCVIRPFCKNARTAFWCKCVVREADERRGGRRLQNASAPERESNIKKGCKMTLICAEQPTLQLS